MQIKCIPRESKIGLFQQGKMYQNKLNDDVWLCGTRFMTVLYSSKTEMVGCKKEICNVCESEFELFTGRLELLT